MRKLNLPAYDFRYRTEGEQRFARYLVEEKGFPASLIMTEYSLKLNKLSRRCDILVHKPAGHPALLVECKAPEVTISQASFDQVARYNLAFKVSYLIVTNGLKHYCCLIDFETEKITFLKEIPSYDSLIISL